MREPWQIPQSWAWVETREIAEIVGGGTPRTDEPANFDGGDVPWVTPADLSGYKNKHISRGARNITKRGLDNSGARLMPEGTVLFSSRAPIGYVAIASNPVSTNQGFKSFVLRSGISPDYAYYYLQRAKDLAIELSSGTTFREISGAKAAVIPFPVAPPAEQERIVGEIEKQLTRLDVAVAALKRVQANLKRYRAAVLKAACEGRLVPTEAELASALPTDRQEPLTVTTPGLPPLSEGWTWITLGSILQSIEAGKSFKCEERPPVRGEVGVVKVSAVTWGEFDEDESKTCLEASRLKENYLIREGDFLFSRANTIELVGACVIVKSIKRQLMLSDKILRFNLNSIPKEWVLYCLRSKLGRSEIERLSTGNQESMRNIGQARIRSIRIPRPPLAELERIIPELERRLSIINEIALEVASDLKRAERLRQSILKCAFEGKLVPQDPNDEPASILLERIRGAATHSGTAIPGCAPPLKNKPSRKLAHRKSPLQVLS